MDSVQSVVKEVAAMPPGKRYMLIGGVLVLIAILIGCIVFIVKTMAVTSTPSNIRRITRVQTGLLNARYMGVSLKRQGLESTWKSVAADEQLLINTRILATRMTGYLGPFDNGVFDPDAAVRLALTMGSRCLILEIDSLNGTDPTLVYRDSNDYVRSLNEGSIQQVAQSLANRAFSVASDSVPPRVASSPLLLVLYFRFTPDSFQTTSKYLTFLGKVAKQLRPLEPFLLGSTPQGDFRRQANESQLFFYPTSLYERKIILLCNVDTSAFRSKATYGLASMPANEDLDRLVHCRIYSRESPSGLGSTTNPTQTREPAAVLTTPQYWLTMPPDRIVDAVQQTKRAFTIVMNPAASKDLPKETLKALYRKFGVNAVPVSLFDDVDRTNRWIGPGGEFQASSWVAKEDLLRFKPPKPILVLKQTPKANAGGGAVIAPKL